MSRRTTPSRLATISETPFSWFELEFLYDAALVESLKVSIPARSRRWIPDTASYQQFWNELGCPRSVIHSKIWIIEDSHRETVETLLKHYGQPWLVRPSKEERCAFCGQPQVDLPGHLLTGSCIDQARGNRNATQASDYRQVEI